MSRHNPKLSTYKVKMTLKPDLDASVLALASFMGRLEQLRREDLPRYEKKFKDRLNDQVTTEIAVFNTELREERKQIEEKIAVRPRKGKTRLHDSCGGACVSIRC